jgi:hypothetical protein
LWRREKLLAAKFGGESIVKIAGAIKVAGAETDVTNLSHGASLLAASAQPVGRE